MQRVAPNAGRPGSRPAYPTGLFLAGLLFAIPATALAESGTFTVFSGFDYSSGEYGSDQETEIFSIPLIFKYQTERWTFKVSVPYVRITGPGNVVPTLGQVGNPQQPRRVTEEGMGDTVVSVTNTVYQNAADGFLVDLTGKVKFDTADEDKGLGTGENDYTVQADLYKGYGKFTALGALGYRVYGNTEFGELRNVFYGSFGGAYKVTPQATAGVLYDYRPRITSSGSQISELMGFINYKITPSWKAQGYLIRGLADGSPDYGGGALINYAF